MEQVKNDLNVATITKTQTSASAKRYQKYFDVAETTSVERQVNAIAYSRAKVVLITAYCVLALLLALAVTNFVLMSTISSNISTLEQIVQTEEVKSSNYENDIQNVLASIEATNWEETAYTAEGQKQVVEIAPIYVSTETSEVQEQTNWFNEFTKFISQVFGG